MFGRCIDAVSERLLADRERVEIAVDVAQDSEKDWLHCMQAPRGAIGVSRGGEAWLAVHVVEMELVGAGSAGGVNVIVSDVEGLKKRLLAIDEHRNAVFACVFEKDHLFLAERQALG